MNEGKSIALWTKYLPAIRILLKKAVNEAQKISFNMEILNGKIENSMGVPPMGKDLFAVLNSDMLTKNFMVDKKIMIQMTRSSLVTFKCD